MYLYASPRREFYTNSSIPYPHHCFYPLICHPTPNTINPPYKSFAAILLAPLILPP